MGERFNISSCICNLYTVEHGVQKAQKSSSQLEPNFPLTCHFCAYWRHAWIRRRPLQRLSKEFTEGKGQSVE